MKNQKKKNADRPPRKWNNWDWERISFWVLFVSLLLSVVYVVIRMVTVPNMNKNTMSDYALKLLQCAMGILVMFLPNFLERKFQLTIPSYMTVMYFVFLYCAVYLGEMRSFYYHVPHWDTILHTFSGGMLGALGFIVVDLLNKSERTTVSLSPLFVALFAFSFAVAFGVIWEIWEFSWDGALNLNMQKYAMEGGKPMIGRAALLDTMKDLIVDTLGALVVSIFGGVTQWKQRKKQLTVDAGMDLPVDVTDQRLAEDVLPPDKGQKS